ncbi:MAG: MaoC family dehydratase [Burkholderiales bacterium]|nr:MaoC family dehydratase [Burkholderiales bacterium]
MSRPAFEFYWEDFPVGLVRETGRHTFSEEEIVAFARQYDRQRYHVDPASARETIFGGLIASGWHTCAIAMRLMCDAYLTRSACLGSPGLDSLKWLRPVRSGEGITFRSRVLVSRPSSSKPELGLTKFLWDAVNADGEIVLAMEGWQLFERRRKEGR